MSRVDETRVMKHEAAPTLIPAKPDARVARFFAWYTRRLFAKKFFAVRLTPGSLGCLRSIHEHAGPAIIVMTHGSWWDPMTAILLNNATATRQRPARPPAAPMDAAMLRRFGFFKKLGVFGIDPDSPASLEAMGRYMLERFGAEPRTTLWITAQGHFHDPRTKPRLRPGAAWLAARVPGVRVLCCAVEYAFWTDQKAETFVHIEEVQPGRAESAAESAEGSPTNPASPSTTAWLRSMQSTMERAAASLADAVISRDPSRFETLHAAGTSINPAYDLWQRLTGKGNAIEVRGPRADNPHGVHR